jgi:hypothetical protein
MTPTNRSAEGIARAWHALGLRKCLKAWEIIKEGYWRQLIVDARKARSAETHP